MSKHTPGPWQHQKASRAGRVVPVANPLKLIAYVDGVSRGGRGNLSNPETLGNARLIAAAPDLLAALKMAVQQEDGAYYHSDCVPQWLVDAKAAIAKAEGRK